MKVAIMTDSTSDLSSELIQQYDIKMIPLKVVYKDREYKDREEITPQEVYDSLDKEVPTTSLPSPAEANEMFNKLKGEGYTHVIAIHISSGLSGTYNVVRTMAEQFSDMVIEVIDSKMLSMGLGFTVIEAAKTLRETGSFEQTVAKAKEVVKKTKTYFIVATLEYLRRGGRIGLVAGTVGEILQLKPIISINEEGVYYTHSKVRGRKKSLSDLFELVKERVSQGPVKIAVAHGGAEEEAKELLDKIKELPNVVDSLLTQIGPVLVVHTGPGLIGVVITPA